MFCLLNINLSRIILKRVKSMSWKCMNALQIPFIYTYAFLYVFATHLARQVSTNCKTYFSFKVSKECKTILKNCIKHLKVYKYYVNTKIKLQTRGKMCITICIPFVFHETNLWHSVLKPKIPHKKKKNYKIRNVVFILHLRFFSFPRQTQSFID